MKRFYLFCFLLIVGNYPSLFAQQETSALKSITKSETHSIRLLPDNENYMQSFPISLEKKGFLEGKLNCTTQGNVPANYSHLSFFLYQKDINKSLIFKKSAVFKQSATLSTEITDDDLSIGKDFLFTAKLSLAYVECNCTLDITYTELVPIEKMTNSNVPINEIKSSTVKKQRTTLPRKK